MPKRMVILACVACGAKHAAPPAQTGSAAAMPAAPPPDAPLPPIGVATEATRTQCPPRLVGWQGTACVVSAATADCKYHGGHCACHASENCPGGANLGHPAPPVPRGSPPPPPPRDPAAWVCVQDVRPDGCPGDEPQRNAPCALDHACSYPVHCWDENEWSCVAGHWTVQLKQHGPPP